MNCHRFEMLVRDLVRDWPMDAAICDSALGHAKTCPRCAACLADERAMAMGLRAVAEKAGNQEAPERIEAALLRAFREHARAGVAPMIRSVPARAGHWPRWVAGTAATILAAISLVFSASGKRYNKCERQRK